MNLEVIDNFFDDGVCKTLEENLLLNTFPWGYLPKSIETGLATNQLIDFMFVHNFIQDVDDIHKQMLADAGEEDRDFMVSPCFNIIEPTIKPIMEYFDLEEFSLLRIKVNLDTNQFLPRPHAAHTDYPIKTYEGESYITAILHVNDNNGYTVVGEENIDQKQNRLIVFDGSSKHYGVTQTDTEARLVVNYNFKGELHD